jgi:hypothetical protein
MKHGILISAYKNLNHIEEIIDFFNDDFRFYIHIDKKSQLSEAEIEKLKKNKKVAFVSRQYVTNWGGTHMLKSILLLIKEVLKDPAIEYIHLISGGDFPIKSSTYFTEYFTKNKGKEFIENFSLPSTRWADGGMNRVLMYNLYDQFNGKSYSGSRIITTTQKLQKLFGIKRKLASTLPPLYGGSTWWSLSRECLSYVIEYTETKPELLERLRYSFCSEEIYFQTVVMNSPFKDKVVDDSLRYILWEYKNNSIPAVLDELDFVTLKESHHLFARKFEEPVSVKLRNELKQTL